MIKDVVDVVGRWTCDDISPSYGVCRSLSVPVSVQGVKWYNYLYACVSDVEVQSSVKVDVV